MTHVTLTTITIHKCMFCTKQSLRYLYMCILIIYFFLEWLQKIAIDWAANGINVCIVDWHRISWENYNYDFVSQINVRRVANYLVEVIDSLEGNGLAVSQTSLVGHSLGAQVSGMAGAALKRNGKILKAIYGECRFCIRSVHILLLLIAFSC